MGKTHAGLFSGFVATGKGEFHSTVYLGRNPRFEYLGVKVFSYEGASILRGAFYINPLSCTFGMSSLF